VVLAAAIVVVALTARLGLWQLDRANTKLALQAARDAADRLPPLTEAALADAASEQRVATLRGRLRNELSVWLENRPHHGQMGFILLTPLELGDGSLIWLQRGWQPRSAAGYEKPRWPWPDEQASSVEVGGRLLRHASRAYELASAGNGPVRQNLDLSVTPAAGQRLQPWVLWQLDGCAPLRCDWPAPDLGVAKHHGYAVQWFALSALTLGLYVWFQLIAPRRRRTA